jgi:hypothetical protein
MISTGTEASRAFRNLSKISGSDDRNPFGTEDNFRLTLILRRSTPVVWAFMQSSYLIRASKVSCGKRYNTIHFFPISRQPLTISADFSVLSLIGRHPYLRYKVLGPIACTALVISSHDLDLWRAEQARAAIAVTNGPCTIRSIGEGGASFGKASEFMHS